MRKAAIILGTLLLAAGSGAVALGQHVADANPALAAAVSPLSGSAKAALASRVAAAGLADQLSGRQSALTTDALRGVRLPPLALELALEGYKREPLAIDAVRVIAIDLLARRRDPQALAVLEGARALSRRSTGVSILLLDRYGREGRDRDGMAVLDELLRRRSNAHSDLIAGLVANLQRDELLPDYRRLLSSKPPWSDIFWRQLAQSPPGLQNALLEARLP